MSYRISRWEKSGRSGWEVDIRITFADGTKFRERKKSPLSGHDATKRWAQHREQEILRENDEGPRDPEPGPKAKTESTSSEVPTLSEFSDRFVAEYAVAEKQKPSEIDSKKSILKHHLIPQLGHKRLDQITTPDIQKLKVTFMSGIPGPKPGTWKIRPTTKNSTINNRLTVLGKLLRVACDWGVIPTMPCTVRLLKVSHVDLPRYEEEELARLVENAEKLGSGHLLAVLLGADAGLRRGEILGLNQQDLDFKRRQVHIQRHVYKGKEGPTKGGKGRYVPMTDALCNALQGHRHLRGDRVLWFLEQDTKKWREVTPKILRTWMAATEKRAGFSPRGAIHILRHTFCSRLAMANAPVMTIKELAGHSRIETTLRYMHLSKGAKHDAIALLNAGAG